MNNDQDESLVFRSDDINATHSRKNKDNYFVRVTNNPILRFFLRQKEIEEEPEPKPQAIKAPPRPKPQFRTTIRISTSKFEEPLKRSRQLSKIFCTVAILMTLFAGFFAYYLFFNSK